MGCLGVVVGGACGTTGCGGVTMGCSGACGAAAEADASGAADGAAGAEATTLAVDWAAASESAAAPFVVSLAAGAGVEDVAAAGSADPVAGVV